VTPRERKEPTLGQGKDQGEQTVATNTIRKKKNRDNGNLKPETPWLSLGELVERTLTNRERKSPRDQRQRTVARNHSRSSRAVRRKKSSNV